MNRKLFVLHCRLDVFSALQSPSSNATRWARAAATLNAGHDRYTLGRAPHARACVRVESEHVVIRHRLVADRGCTCTPTRVDNRPGCRRIDTVRGPFRRCWLLSSVLSVPLGPLPRDPAIGLERRGWSRMHRWKGRVCRGSLGVAPALVGHPW